MTTNQSSEITQAVSEQLISDMLKERISNRRWNLVKRLLLLLSVVLGLVYYVAFVLTVWGYKMVPNSEIVGIVRLQGEIGAGGLASADKVIPALRRAFEAPNVKAIALSIDSPGGAPVEAERIFNAIESMKKLHPKPVYAFINNVGASAAYMVAIHADTIYAANYSLVGSIGAVMSGWDFHKAMDKLNIAQRVYASGNLKTMMNPYAPMSAEAEAKATTLIQKMGDQFKGDVQKARGAKLSTSLDIATGEVWNGFDAKRVGLIDEVGTLDDVVASKFNLKTFDFGPGKPSFPGISTLAEDFGRGMMSVFLEQSSFRVK